MRSPLALWHLLSLDAPTVAALWTWFIARTCGVTLPASAIAAMFLAVWTLYAADRLLDARNASATDLEERHRFHHRHRRVFLAAILVASFLLANLLPTLLPAALRLYVVLGALLFGWFLLIHTRLAASSRLPKELAVGIFFPAAVFIPTIARRPDLRLELLPAALLFAAACTLNCLYLYAWEHPQNRTRAHWTTRFATRRLSLITSAAIAVAFVCVPFVSYASSASRPFASPATPLAIAAAVSALFLLLLDRSARRFSALHLRAAADLALLSPLLLVPFLRGPQ